MRTVGPGIPVSARTGPDGVFMCDACGASNYRSRMRRRPDGQLVCRTHPLRRDIVVMAEIEVATAEKVAGLAEASAEAEASFDKGRNQSCDRAQVHVGHDGVSNVLPNGSVWVPGHLVVGGAGETVTA